MSELSRTQPQNGFEGSLGFVTGEAEEIFDTYSRFNLVFDKDKAGDFFVVHGGGQAPSRYLVTEFDRKTEDITKALESCGVEHMEVMRIEHGNCIYEVPPNAKPLLGERLHFNRESDDTYISDEELFGKVGKLWGSVYKATNCLPDSTVLSHTGMREFTGQEKQMVFPVPPYGDCAEVEDQGQAAGIFESSIRKELEAGYPNSPIERIVGSARMSFQEAVENGPRAS